VLAAVAAAIVAVVGFFGGLQFAGSDDDNDVVFAADAITLPLDGDAGQARVVWSASEDRAVLIAAGLGEPGDGKAYELWLIDAAGANPTGLFTPDADGNVTIELPLDGRDPAAWGITIEPDTGSDQPTEPILLIGETA
jgi:anti-sigma-K factor RskA